MEQVGNALDAALRLMLFLLIIFVPLGLWKLIEIVWWLVMHVRIVT